MGRNNSYTLEYAPSAYTDLDEILNYISTELQAPETAMGQIERIEKAILTLRAFPYRIPPAKDATIARKGYRMLVVDNYAVFFIVDEDKRIVSIRRVIYGKRNFSWLM